MAPSQEGGVGMPGTHHGATWHLALGFWLRDGNPEVLKVVDSLVENCP